MITNLMRLWISITVLLTLTSTARTAGPPSTSHDWQRIYAACLDGTKSTLTQRGLDPASICGCIRDELRKIPASQMNENFQSVQSACIQRAKTSPLPDDWPAEGIDRSNRKCRANLPQDVLPSKADLYCSCSVSNTLEVISWRQYLLLDSAVRIKGMNNLDSEERAILTKALEVRNYCSLKIK